MLCIVWSEISKENENKGVPHFDQVVPCPSQISTQEVQHPRRRITGQSTAVQALETRAVVLTPSGFLQVKYPQRLECTDRRQCASPKQQRQL